MVRQVKAAPRPQHVAIIQDGNRRYADKIGEDWLTLDIKLKEKLAELENDPLVKQFANISQEKNNDASSEF
ncbi:MAG: hypothetical protein WCI87_08275, partial [Euryarchaeota archaeon]